MWKAVLTLIAIVLVAPVPGAGHAEAGTGYFNPPGAGTVTVVDRPCFVAPYSVHLVLDDDTYGWEVDWDIYDPSGNRISGGFIFGAGGGGSRQINDELSFWIAEPARHLHDGRYRATRDAQFNETKMALTPASFRVVDTAMPPPTPPSTVEQTWTTTLTSAWLLDRRRLGRNVYRQGEVHVRLPVVQVLPAIRGRRVSIEAKHNGSWSRIYAKAYVGVASRVRLKVPYKYDKIRAKAGRLVANTDDSPVIIDTADKS